MRTKLVVAVALLLTGAGIGALYFERSRVDEIHGEEGSRAKESVSHTSTNAVSSANQAKAETTARTSSAKSLDEGHGDVPANADSVVREFRRAQECRVARAKITGMQNMIAACETTVMDSPGYKFCKSRTEGFGEKIQAMTEQMANCATDFTSIEGEYFRSVANAAKQGDYDAQFCYIEGDFKGGTSADDVYAYQKEASRYANEAFARGDWRIAVLLETKGSSLGHSGNWLRFLSIDVPVGTRATVYSMNRLLRLGAVGDYAANLDRMAERGGLSSEEISNAEEWASKTYKTYFVDSPRLSKEPKTCIPRA